MNAINLRAADFKDKIVMDVGAGTGILSLFAAKAGAKKVYAIEPSQMHKLARKIVEENHLSATISVINKKVEDLILNEDVPQVDIIISEWMGYCLLYEGMLDSVLYARDHYLVKGGLIFPERARIYVAGINDFEYKMKSDSFYDLNSNPYGISLKTYQKQKSSFVCVDRIDPLLLITNDSKIFDVDINTCKVDDLQFSSEYHLRVNP